LLEARRGTSGYRIYGAEDVAVLEQIVALKFITMRREPPSRVALLQGTLDLLILRTLIAGPTHGHAIAKHIQRTSEDLLQVETGSLYPALHRLEVKDWIAASCALSAKGTRARFYRLTPLGRKQLVAERSRWEAASRAMALVLSPKTKVCG
jgi:PadR family transcriptional regulator, regulatory protein PadR